MAEVSTDTERERVHAALVAFGLFDGTIDALPTPEPITGGVSSGIFRVSLASGSVVVKWALPELRVAGPWAAPVERNRFEVAYLRIADGVVPGAFPAILGADPDAGIFVMEDLGALPVWKEQLRDGRIDPRVASALGSVVGRVHAATADDAEVAAAFATDDLFHALRTEPYLLAAAAAVPSAADRLHELATSLASTRRVLVHGDVSPKNVLVRAAAPVLLDAECAWYGDPAFDLAFAANHLLLKGVWHPEHRAAYLDCLDALNDAYLREVSWEPATDVEARAAALLPALALARVRGRSPVEYLEPDRQALVEDLAIDLLRATSPVGTIGEIAEVWRAIDGGAR